jgi:hypothetical protein
MSVGCPHDPLYACLKCRKIAAAVALQNVRCPTRVGPLSVQQCVLNAGHPGTPDDCICIRAEGPMKLLPKGGKAI